MKALLHAPWDGTRRPLSAVGGLWQAQEGMKLPASGPRWISIWLLLAVACIMGWIVWRCRTDSGVRFLTGPAPAQWILYPSVPDIQAHRIPKPGQEVSTVFQRNFLLQRAPSNAPLRLRALERGEVRINRSEERRVGKECRSRWSPY